MYPELKENRPHGTKEYPYTQYHMRRPRHLHPTEYKSRFPKGFHVPVHWHEEVEIIYLKKGQLRVSIGDESFELRPGEVYFVNPGELHFMESEDVEVDYFTILFPLEFISFQTEDLLEKEILRPMRNRKLLIQKNITGKACEGKIVEHLQEMIGANREKADGYQLRTRILLLEILELLVKNQCIYQPALLNPTNVQRDMLLYIQKHFAEKITLEMLAKEFHLSEKYISRYFKEHFSISFMQYVGHLRMTKAKELLTKTDLPVTEVALSCGYPSVNLFIRNFKSAYQVTPLQYRKMEA